MIFGICGGEPAADLDGFLDERQRVAGEAEVVKPDGEVSQRAGEVGQVLRGAGSQFPEESSGFLGDGQRVGGAAELGQRDAKIAGGPAAEALGFQSGQAVERKPYDLLFGERKAPDGTQLGRPPGSGRQAADIHAALLAAEPHAIAERKRELRLEATRQARQSPLFFDLTLSLSKSVSIFHASLGENARLAREAGDKAGEQYWSGLVAEVDAMIYEAVRTGFAYFQREAGYTRTGSHNKRAGGRETGQWREADLIVAHWLQHTSRDGDMQLHVHSQIAHVARTTVDGKWRAPDSLGYNEHVGAVGAITAQHLEEALTSRFEARYGRAPSQRELAQLEKST